MSAPACSLCIVPPSEAVLWRDDRYRIIDAGERDYPGYCRVIWSAYVREMSDLAEADRRYLMGVVYALEESLRVLLRPAKVNLASLGNQVPHLHWHVIPRFADDPHFPDPIWAAPRREGRKRPWDRDALQRALGRRLGGRE